MVEKEKKEDKEEKEKKEKKEKEENEKFKNEISELLSLFESKKLGIKLDDYMNYVEKMLDKWNKKVKDSALLDHLSGCTLKLLEPGFKERELSTFSDKLDSNRKSILMKVCYASYERISNKKDVYGIRPAKIINIHNKLVTSEGVGGVARSLFSIQK